MISSVRPLPALALMSLLFASSCTGYQYKADPKPDVIYVPTPDAVVERMLEMAEVRADDTLYDLGSGDGRIVITAAKERGARGTGVEIDPQLIAQSRRNAEKAGVADKVRFIESDLFTMNFRDATVVTLYLGRSVNIRLRDRLLAELAPGTRVVSHAFDMGEWRPDETAGVIGHDVFFWIVPANVEGKWRWTQPDAARTQRAELDLRQTYQRVEGELRLGDAAAPLRDAVLRGDRLYFETTQAVNGQPVAVRFEGRIDGDRLHGDQYIGGIRRPWTAERIRQTAGSS